MKSFSDKNKNASTGARVGYNYGNILDQKRYFFALNFIKDKNVLDVATGNGWGAFLMAHVANHIVGVDISPLAIKTAEYYFAKDNLKFICSEEWDTLTEDNSFDVVTSFETLEHLEDPKSFLQKIKNKLKKDGTLILSTPNFHCMNNPNQKIPRNPYHVKEYSKAELEILFSNFFTVEKYLGQYPIKADSQDVLNYRKYVRDAWFSYKMSSKLGLFGKVLGRCMGKIGLLCLYEFAHTTDCNPVEVSDGFEPVYHVFQLKPC